MLTKILIADDDSISRRLLQGLLTNWGYPVVEAEDGEAAQRELLAADAPRLAILDWMMPGLNGVDVITALRAAKNDLYTYVLLLTSKSEKNDILLGLETGADDYLTKPFDAQELRARLQVGQRILDLQQRLVSALSNSEFRATHDPLTGLYNRGAIMGLLKREASRCDREGAAMGGILVDIDHFKRINDTMGHSVGDEVLLEVAGRMRSALRSYDFLGRYGGEEFLVVAPGCGPEEIVEVAERLRYSVAEHPVRIGTLKVEVTVSAGTSILDHTGETMTLLQRADKALYAAKEHGRNRVKFEPGVEETLMRVPLTGLTPEQVPINQVH